MTGLLNKNYSFKQLKLFRSSIYFILAVLAIISCYVYYIYDIHYPLYITAVYFFLILGCAYFFIRHNLFFQSRYLAYVFTCTLSFLYSYAEGYDAIAILFFLPLVVIVPIVVTKKHQYMFQSALFYGTWSVFMVATLMVTKDRGIVLINQPDTLTVLKTLNLSFVFLLCVFYSIFGLIQERWYIERLRKGKLAAEDLKNKRMTMLSSLGHEIRTQVTSINAASKMLMETPLRDDQKPMIEILDYCTNQMFYLINDILDLRKLEAGMFVLQPEPHNIYKVIYNATLPIRERATEKKLELLTVIDERINSHWVLVDETRLNQVLHNLLSNALKYTLKGSITLTASLVDEDPEVLTIHVEVADTGIGIKEENIERIFDSFWQAKPDDIPIYGGSGLGLTISRNIITEMGSHLKVESKLNRGSTFYFTLNLKRVPHPDTLVSRIEAHGGNLAGKHVLIAEDNHISLVFASRLLEQKGMIVHQAKNGVEAIEALKSAPGIRVILLDLEMPEMNGYAAVGELKKISGVSKIIAFTANIPDNALSEKLSQLGFDDILSKPFNKNELIRTVDKHLSSARR